MEATLLVDEVIEEVPSAPPAPHSKHPAAAAGRAAVEQAETCAVALCSTIGSAGAEAFNWWKRVAQRHIETVRSIVQKLRGWLWQLIDFVLEVRGGVAFV